MCREEVGETWRGLPTIGCRAHVEEFRFVSGKFLRAPVLHVVLIFMCVVCRGGLVLS